MILLAAAVLVVCEMIFMRYVLRASTIWQTEFVVYSLMAATFLGSPYVLLYRGHVGVDLLPNMAGPRGRFLLELIGGIISLLPLPVGAALLCLQYIAELMKEADALSQAEGVQDGPA